MANNIDLKDLERKAFSSYFHDGMWDLYGGLILLGFGLSVITEQMFVMIICVILAMVPLLIRKQIVIPRLGAVRFSPQRQAKTRRAKVIAVTIGCVTLLLGVVMAGLFSSNVMPSWFDIWISDYFLIFFGGMIAVIVAIGAFIVGVKRFYIYSLLTFAAFYLANFLRGDDMEGIPIATAGGLVLLSGIGILTRFLTTNPLPNKEEA